MIQEKALINEQIKELNSALKSFPKGKFFYTKNGEYYKWYSSDGKNMTYIPKKKRHLAEKLAAKRFLTHLLDDLEAEVKAIDYYIQKRKPEKDQANQVYFQDEEYRKLIAPYFEPVSEKLQEWEKSSFMSNPKFPEQLIHKSISGNLVRSKSEAMIDMFLFQKKIPYHYEEEMKLGGNFIYPDFTIRHPRTGEFYYWEHFGMIDDPVYCQKMLQKLRTYTSHGIYPSVQLISTYETKDYPLNMETFEKTIELYFG